jgi:hypothetical protein
MDLLHRYLRREQVVCERIERSYNMDMELGHWQTLGWSIREPRLGERSSILSRLDKARGEFKCQHVPWSVQTQKLDKRVGDLASSRTTFAPVFWTNEETILAAFSFIAEDPAAMILLEIESFTTDTMLT